MSSFVSYISKCHRQLQIQGLLKMNKENTVNRSKLSEDFAEINKEIDIENIKKTYSSIKVIIGNEACDLDSAVCSLTYGFFLDFMNKDFDNVITVPLLNIVQQDFLLRTEVQYWLAKFKISPSMLIFRDDINLEKLIEAGNVDVYLVDHNVLSPSDAFLEPFIDAIIDHHLVERTSTPVHGMTIEPVGSCATLVAEKILKEAPILLEYDVVHLLYGAIVVDTINFSESAKNTTEKDIEMAEQLEFILQMGCEKRIEIFEELSKVKSDVSCLSSGDLLRKDLKLVAANNLTIAMSSVPLLVQEFLLRDGVERGIMRALGENSWDILIMMGICVTESVRRDIAVVSNKKIYRQQLSSYLSEVSDRILSLDPKPTPNDIAICSLFDQNNSAASRKVVLPLVRKWLDDQR